MTVKVRLLNFGDMKELVHWEVEIHGANKREKSNEITVNFHAHNLHNPPKFWTDSNGLRMMKRVINHRDSFKINTPQKTSSNFFPVGSAISIRDPDTML